MSQDLRFVLVYHLNDYKKKCTGRLGAWAVLEATKRFTNEGLGFPRPTSILARLSAVPGANVGDAVTYLRRAGSVYCAYR